MPGDAFDELDALLVELARLRAREAALVEALAEAERRVTLGGIPPRPDQTWANLALPAPPSAGDDTAPPLHRRTRDEDVLDTDADKERTD